MTMLKFSVVSFIGVVMLIITISYYIPLSIANPVKDLCEVTKQVSEGNLEVRARIDEGGEISVLGESLNVMIDKINGLLEQVTKEQIRLRKAEFELLQSQINPHFLYNTLDAIVWLAESGEQQKVVNMVGSLSEFFRTSLNQGKEIVTTKGKLKQAAYSYRTKNEPLDLEIPLAVLVDGNTASAAEIFPSPSASPFCTGGSPSQRSQ